MKCSNCGADIPAGAQHCGGCGAFLVTARQTTPTPTGNIGDDAAVRMLLPVGRSGWAIAAGYAGLLSPLLVFAPLALLLGILALRDINRNPRRRGFGRAIFGILMGALFSLVGLGVWALGPAMLDVLKAAGNAAGPAAPG